MASARQEGDDAAMKELKRVVEGYISGAMTFSRETKGEEEENSGEAKRAYTMVFAHGDAVGITLFRCYGEAFACFSHSFFFAQPWHRREPISIVASATDEAVQHLGARKEAMPILPGQEHSFYYKVKLTWDKPENGTSHLFFAIGMDPTKTRQLLLITRDQERVNAKFMLMESC